MKIEKLETNNIRPRPGLVIDSEYELWKSTLNKINEIIDTLNILFTPAKLGENKFYVEVDREGKDKK